MGTGEQETEASSMMGVFVLSLGVGNFGMDSAFWSGP